MPLSFALLEVPISFPGFLNSVLLRDVSNDFESWPAVKGVLQCLSFAFGGTNFVPVFLNRAAEMYPMV